MLLEIPSQPSMITGLIQDLGLPTAMAAALFFYMYKKDDRDVKMQKEREEKENERFAAQAENYQKIIEKQTDRHERREDMLRDSVDGCASAIIALKEELYRRGDKS